jgi:NAD-specific glutamate dehydrogenase
MNRPLQAIVFDFDGVIADSEPLHLRAFQQALAEQQIELTGRDYYSRYLGYDDVGLVQALATDRGIAMSDREITAMGARKELDELAVTRAYTRLGEVLGLDWSQQQVARFVPADNWERLLAAGLSRDFEQLRIDFLNRTRGEEPDESVDRWVDRNPKRIAQFRALVDRAKLAGTVSAPMLAQIASQARILLSR